MVLGLDTLFLKPGIKQREVQMAMDIARSGFPLEITDFSSDLTSR